MLSTIFWSFVAVCFIRVILQKTLIGKTIVLIFKTVMEIFKMGYKMAFKMYQYTKKMSCKLDNKKVDKPENVIDLKEKKEKIQK